MKSAAVIGIGCMCFLAGIGVGAGVAWMVSGKNTTRLSDAERFLIEQTSYAEGWEAGYEDCRDERGNDDDRESGESSEAPQDDDLIPD